jgi:hypothetical protein
VLFRKADEALVLRIAEQLRDAGHDVSSDGEGKIGPAWVPRAEEKIHATEVVVPLVSEASL